MAHRNRSDDSEESKTREREEFAREQAEAARARDSMRRQLFTAYRLWTVCPDKRCKRARACSGDTELCVRQRWHVYVSDETRALLTKTFELVSDGMPAREAVAAAQADIVRRQQLAAEFDARRQAEKPAAPVAPAPIRRSAPVHHGPRIRGLD